MAINKVEYDGNTLMDITDTTANAGDVASGKVFYAANGVRTTGTAQGGGGSSTDVQINGTSIVDNNVANIITKSPYNSSTNVITTETDLNTKQDKLMESVWRYVIPGVVYEHASGLVKDAIVNVYSDAASEYNSQALISAISSQETYYLNNINYPLTKMILGETGDETYIAVYNLDFDYSGESEMGIKRVDTTKPCFGVILGQEEEAPSGHVLIIVSTEEIRQVPWAFVKEKDVEYVAPVAITGDYEDLINKPDSTIFVDSYENLPYNVPEYYLAYVKNSSLYDITSLSDYNYDNTLMNYISPFEEPDFSTFIDNHTSSFSLIYNDILNNQLVATATTVLNIWVLLISQTITNAGYTYATQEIDSPELKLQQGWCYLEEDYAGVAVSVDFNDVPLIPIRLMTMGTPVGNVYNSNYIFCDCKKHWAGEYRFINGEWEYQQIVKTTFIDDSSDTVPTSGLIYNIINKNIEAIEQIQQALNS